jgi:hypothetical protein
MVNVVHYIQKPLCNSLATILTVIGSPRLLSSLIRRTLVMQNCSKRSKAVYFWACHIGEPTTCGGGLFQGRLYKCHRLVLGGIKNSQRVSIGRRRFGERSQEASCIAQEIYSPYIHFSRLGGLDLLWYENLSLYLWNIPNDCPQLVDRDSAVMQVGNEVSHATDSNHVTINKFGQHERQRYQPVGDAIKELIKGVTLPVPAPGEYLTLDPVT